MATTIIQGNNLLLSLEWNISLYFTILNALPPFSLMSFHSYNDIGTSSAFELAGCFGQLTKLTNLSIFLKWENLMSERQLLILYLYSGNNKMGKSAKEIIKGISNLALLETLEINLK